MIAVLGGFADVERDLIRTRTAEGRSRAQKRGQRMGRPSKLTDAQKAEARKRRAEGATLAELGAQLRRGEEYDFKAISYDSIAARNTCPSRKEARAAHHICSRIYN
jgi:DNA invertase Pin-like site-specific DNA recombinase